MHYERIENALDVCSDHVQNLDPSNLKDKELETYLVSGLVVLIVSEYEEYLEQLFGKRAEQCGDQHASNYIKKTLSQQFRSPDLSKINETLNRFDGDYKTVFLGEVENSPQHAAWDSIMKARHAVVHKKGNLNMTLLELKEKYPLTKSLISSVENILGIAS